MIRATPFEIVSGRFHIVFSHSSSLNHRKYGQQVLHFISLLSLTISGFHDEVQFLTFHNLLHCVAEETSCFRFH
jgi:hypothetical protein